MKIRYAAYSLELKYPFGVSSNTRTHTPTVFVELEHEGLFGYGEACIPAYLGETMEDTLNFLHQTIRPFLDFKDPLQVKEISSYFDKKVSDRNAAKAAINIALHDLAGKMEERAVHARFNIGFNPVTTSCTIGIDPDEEVIRKKIEEAKDFSILKVKLGTDHDRDIISLIRKFTDKPIYADANQGWTDLSEAVRLVNWLSEHQVILIEQPMPISMRQEMKSLTKMSPLPIIADESVKRLKDLDELSECFSGINIKLMKSGGITEAYEMIERAKKLGLKVMLGCMAESTCATAAMAQLSSLADYIDLDAPFLIKNDPFEGIRYDNGKLILNNTPGIGVSLRSELVHF